MSTPHQTLIDLLVRQATDNPDRRGYTFLEDGEIEAARLTYAEMSEQVRAVAAALQAHHAEGERVLLLYPSGLDFAVAFFGCLYAGAVGVPAYPPLAARLNRTLPRLQAIAADAGSKFVLTTRQILTMSESLHGQAPDLKAMRWIATDDIDLGFAPEWRRPDIAPETLAFLQYTSGSTATPKGVMVTHGNMLANAAYYRDGWEHTPETVTVTWMPNFHDLGLMDGIIQPMFTGYHSVLMSPIAFLQHPLRWLQAISTYRATYSAGPNFAFDLCARKITAEQKSALDLSCWQAALNAAEPVRRETIERFVKAFEGCGFRRTTFAPGYGLAEATLKVCSTRKGAGPVFRAADAAALERNRVVDLPTGQGNARVLAGCGRPDFETFQTKVVIVNSETLRPCSEDEVGEVWVSGPGVAQGYWNKPVETEQIFKAFLADTGDGPFMRTGDLGFMRGGELFLTGRLKDMIIIDGRNLYPHDIELTVERAHRAVRPGCTAAFAVDSPDGEQLVVVAEVERRERLRTGERKSETSGLPPSSVEAIETAIRRAIAEDHDVHVSAVELIKTNTIPKTSSGKIQRHACRVGFLNRTLEILPPEAPPIGTGPLPSAPISSRKIPSVEEIQAWLIGQLSRQLGIPPFKIGVHDEFVRFGLASRELVGLAGDFEEWLGRKLSPTLFYTYPTIALLSRHLGGNQDSIDVSQLPVSREWNEPVAVVGMACRFPGADDPEAFWKLLREGRDMIRPVPADRRGTRGFYPLRAEAAKPYFGGYIDGVDQFDHGFFGISRRDAEHMDPQQRLLLEVAWESIEDAGWMHEHLSGTKIGVFIGLGISDYGRVQLSSPGLSDQYTAVGSALCMAANRISYALNFVGPSLTIDTACSSSLVAVHYACQSLRRGESTAALAGGANLLLSPDITENLVASSFLSPDGRCKAFDASANGYVRGEGVGVVALKLLSRAIADGDVVYSVIRGSAVNQDGRSNGLTAPNQHAQEAVLREAYKQASISPGQVVYVETHGTGTSLGDPIEAKALGKVLAQERLPGSKCAVGSVKTNIGHLEAAAGIAGLIKVSLLLKYGLVPPSLHFKTPNPYIPFDQLPLTVQKELGRRPKPQGLLAAGVSSFGFGGTNCHVVLESSPQAPLTVDLGAANLPGAFLLPLSARSPEALRAVAQRVRDFLVTTPVPVDQVCRTAALRRDHHDWRLAVVAAGRDELIEKLDTYLNGEACAGLSSGRRLAGEAPKVAFVFSGQGNQWAGMAGELLQINHLFRQILAECDELVRGLGGWSILEELAAHESHSRLDRTDIAQPVICALQIALAEYWHTLGVVPEAVVGHSMGEAAAAHVAGILSLKDAMTVIFHRGRIMEKAAGQGKTAATGVGEADLDPLFDRFGDRLGVAAINSPRSTTISGEPKAVEQAVEILEGQGAFARLLPVRYAFHSPQLNSLKYELNGVLYGLKTGPAQVPIFSTVTGKVAQAQDYGAEYWGRNLRETVRFSRTIEEMSGRGLDTFLEIGPHPVLATALSECLEARNRQSTVLASLRRGENANLTVYRSLAELYVRGAEINWTALHPTAGPWVRLPSYPWQHERCWIDEASVAVLGHAPSPSVADPSRETFADRLRAVEWQPSPAPTPDGRTVEGTWIILADGQGIGESLAYRLAKAGGHVIVAVAGDAYGQNGPDRFTLRPTVADDFRRLLADAFPAGAKACRGVVHCGALDARISDADSAKTVEAKTLETALAALGIVRETAGFDWPEPPRVRFVTAGAQPVDDSSPVSLAQSPLWGLGRTVAQEMPRVWGGLIDLDPKSSIEDAARNLFDSVTVEDSEAQIAFRAGRRLVARLVPVRESRTAGAGLNPRADGTYLVTGGLGDLGILTARRLVERGARRVILTGRTPLPPRSEWKTVETGTPLARRVAAVRELESLGAEVHVAALDAENEAALREFLTRWRDEARPPIRGVIHAAGVLANRLIEEQDEASFAAVWRAKVGGAWALDRATAELSLDFLICFGSVASIVGSPGQANYAAANAFLDALVFERRRRGQTGTTVAWGPWGEVGMAARVEKATGQLVHGFDKIPPAEGFRMLERILGNDFTHVLAVAFRPDEFRQVYPAAGAPFFRFVAVQPAKPTVRVSAILIGPEIVLAAPPGERPERIRTYLLQHVSSALGITAAKLDPRTPLTQIGLDSLTATFLKNRIEEDFKVAVPIVSFLQGANLTELSAELHERLEAVMPSPSVPINGALDTVVSSAMFDRIDDLSDEQVGSMLAEIIAAGGSSDET